MRSRQGSRPMFPTTGLLFLPLEYRAVLNSEGMHIWQMASRRAMLHSPPRESNRVIRLPHSVWHRRHRGNSAGDANRVDTTGIRSGPNAAGLRSVRVRGKCSAILKSEERNKRKLLDLLLSPPGKLPLRLIDRSTEAFRRERHSSIEEPSPRRRHACQYPWQ